MAKMPKMPDTESKYFSTVELEKLKRLNIKKKEQTTQEESKKLKETHYRRCSNCGSKLQEVIFKGANIWKCFVCNGAFIQGKDFEKICGKENKILTAILSIFKY